MFQIIGKNAFNQVMQESDIFPGTVMSRSFQGELVGLSWKSVLFIDLIEHVMSICLYQVTF